MTRASRGLAIASVLALSAPMAGSATAEVRRLEAVGAVPVGVGSSGSGVHRAAAIQRALHEAVSRVAREALIDAALPEGGEEEDLSLDEILGENLVPYTARFRILDDRGERPALFAEDPTVDTEYVVIVEVHVDVDRVVARLIEAGLVERPETDAPAVRVRIEVEGVHVYPAYTALREHLLGLDGTRSVTPIEISRERLVLEVASEHAATRLLDDLLLAPSDELSIEPLAADGHGLRLAVTWHEPSEEDLEESPAGRPRP